MAMGLKLEAVILGFWCLKFERVGKEIEWNLERGNALIERERERNSEREAVELVERKFKARCNENCLLRKEELYFKWPSLSCSKGLGQKALAQRRSQWEDYPLIHFDF